ncbi:MAG: hypothetical protein LAN71_13390 [Acidobacteriia bacterium]|nr:hypothetical protein [Terriglobia bacterium]
MKIKFFLFLLGIPLLCGCINFARLYPVRGPLSDQTPPPILHARVTEIFNSGNISVTLADGEVCKGHWRLVRQDLATTGPHAPSAPESNSLSAEWDAVYGPGYFVANILGTRFLARSVLSGNRGSILTVEMYKPDNAPPGSSPGVIKGVAKDNKDNIYKLTF